MTGSGGMTATESNEHDASEVQQSPKVIHQVPEDCIVGSADRNDGSAMFSLPSISPFVIPHQSLCGSFISLVPPPLQPANGGSEHAGQSYRILGHPICRSSPSYRRNEFIFNFCLVLSAADPDFNAYKSVVTKLAQLMLSLEEQSHFLSRDTAASNSGKIYSLCETLVSDLNNYCECMIPIDHLNTLNLKLFPTYAPPPPVKAWQVPIFTVRPESLMDENWDLTMQRIVPHINGIRSVKHIAILADADLGLTKQCMKHLLYYGCLLLLDIFSFSAIYAPTAEFSTTIAADEEMQRECARYVNTGFAPDLTADKHHHAVLSPDASSTGDDIWPLDSAGQPVDGVGIVELFAALRQGPSVREWYTEKSDQLANIDLRRFITFGVIKGFVYRVHKYAYAVNQNAQVRASQAASVVGRDGARNIPNRGHTKAVSRHHPLAETGRDEDGDTDDDTATITSRTNRSHLRQSRRNASPSTDDDDQHDQDPKSNKRSKPRSKPEPEPNAKPNPKTKRHHQVQTDGDNTAARPALRHYLDGTHTFDQICTELEISEADLEKTLKRSGSNCNAHNPSSITNPAPASASASAFVYSRRGSGRGGGWNGGNGANFSDAGAVAGAGVGVGVGVGVGEVLIIHR